MRALTLIFSLFCWGSFAANYEMDVSRSSVGFEIMKYKIGAPVTGKFDRFSGSGEMSGGKNYECFHRYSYE